jgi:signal transduction histidine kinase
MQKLLEAFRAGRSDVKHLLLWMALLLLVAFTLSMQGNRAHSNSNDSANIRQAEQVTPASFQGYSFPSTWRYYLEGGFMLAFLLWAVDRLRTTQMKARLEVVREERERLARELHDTVIQGCTGISVLLEAIASARDGGAAVQGELLNCAREQARRTINEARDAVWNLRQPEKEIDLVELLRDLAVQVMRDSGSSVNVQHNVASLPVSASSAGEISMTVREAICNAVRHSGSERILVDLCSDRKGLCVSVQDYGCGISAAAGPEDSKHYGIVGMQERMRRLGGGLRIDDMPGMGTRVQLMLRPESMRKVSVRI